MYNCTIGAPGRVTQLANGTLDLEHDDGPAYMAIHTEADALLHATQCTLQVPTAHMP